MCTLKQGEKFLDRYRLDAWRPLVRWAVQVVPRFFRFCASGLEIVARLQGNRAWALWQTKVTVGISDRYIVFPEVSGFVR